MCLSLGGERQNQEVTEGPQGEKKIEPMPASWGVAQEGFLEEVMFDLGSEMQDKSEALGGTESLLGRLGEAAVKGRWGEGSHMQSQNGLEAMCSVLKLWKCNITAVRKVSQ